MVVVVMYVCTHELILDICEQVSICNDTCLFLLTILYSSLSHEILIYAIRKKHKEPDDLTVMLLGEQNVLFPDC